MSLPINSTTWDEKYKPKTISDIIGNSVQIKNIVNWLDNYKNIRKRQKSCIFVLGDHGVGKTCSILAILKNKKYRIQLVNLSKLGILKDIDLIVEKLVKNSTIYDIVNNSKPIKNVIVVDEVESITSIIGKKFVLSLLKVNINYKCPIIFISNNKHNKITTQLKKDCTIFEFQQPNFKQLYDYLLKICNNEHIKLRNENIARMIVNYAQFDFRRLLSILQDLRNTYSSTITQKIIDEYYENTKLKDTDCDIFKSTISLLTEKRTIDECVKVYESDKVIIPLMIHQNYIECINGCYAEDEDKYKIAKKIANSLSLGNIVESYIYNEQNWDMHEVHSFYSCINPVHELSKLNITRNNIKIDYPKDLNKTSIKKINKKNIINSNNCLQNLEISDFIYINKLARTLIEEERYIECAKLFEKYNVTIDNIESLLKIDKINETKHVISSSIKKKLTKLLNK
jgi:DNA polymerase III delta prime subunit